MAQVRLILAIGCSQTTRAPGTSIAGIGSGRIKIGRKPVGALEDHHHVFEDVERACVNRPRSGQSATRWRNGQADVGTRQTAGCVLLREKAPSSNSEQP